MEAIEQFSEYLKKVSACKDARIWAKGKTAKQAWDECPRGDWLLWWAFKQKRKTGEFAESDLRTFTLAKGHCAKTVYHLMNDERSRNAVDVAIAFGEGKATRKELDAAAADDYAAAAAYDASAAYYAASAAYYAAAAAYSAYASADASAAYASAAAYYAADASAAAAAAAYYAAPAPAYAADAAAYYAAAAAYYAAADDAAAGGRVKNKKQTADIVRSIITPNFL